MNNVKTREEILTLRQNELVARNNYYAAFTEYIDALNPFTNATTISCGDDRFPIIQDVLKNINADPNLSLPEEVKEEVFANDIDEYQYLMDIVGFSEKIKSKSTGKKVSFGIRLADDFQTIHAHVTLKADKNDKYVDVAKNTAVYHDPNGKRKENQRVKKRVERASKKNLPKI